MNSAMDSTVHSTVHSTTTSPPAHTPGHAAGRTPGHTSGHAPVRSRANPMALPNILTYGRIAAVPFVVGCLFWQNILGGELWLRWLALVVFITAGVSDFLDGYFARIWGQQSSLGRMLDPIADKLLVASCLLILGAEKTIHGWSLLAAIVILCREILVSGLREYLAELRVSVPVTRLAKWKTTLQLVAVGFLRRSRRCYRAGSDQDRHRAAVALGVADALHRVGLSAGGIASPDPGGCVKEDA
jgi:cardiolipin synthase